MARTDTWIEMVRERFPAALYQAAYPLVDSLEVLSHRSPHVEATVGDDIKVVMERQTSTCTCPESEGSQWMCRHKLAVLLRTLRDDGSVTADEIDEEHLRSLARGQLEILPETVRTFLDTCSRQELREIAVDSSPETTSHPWSPSLAAARWSIDALGFADHLYARIDQVLPAESVAEPMTTVSTDLRRALLMLQAAARRAEPVVTLPASSLLLCRLRAVIDASMPVSHEVRALFRDCAEHLESLFALGAIDAEELAGLILELELADDRSTGLCPSLQWTVPSPAVTDAMMERLSALKAEAFDELMNATDIEVEIDPSMVLRWNRLLRLTAELAFAQQDFEALGRTLSRWGGAPYGEFMYRGTWKHSPTRLLPIAVSAARAGQITNLSWSAQVRSSITDHADATGGATASGMSNGVPVDSQRLSPLRNVSLNRLIGVLAQSGYHQEACDTLRDQFRRCPSPEAVPSLQTWWRRLEIEDDVVEWARSIMLGEESDE